MPLIEKLLYLVKSERTDHHVVFSGMCLPAGAHSSATYANPTGTLYLKATLCLLRTNSFMPSLLETSKRTKGLDYSLDPCHLPKMPLEQNQINSIVNPKPKWLQSYTQFY